MRIRWPAHGGTLAVAAVLLAAGCGGASARVAGAAATAAGGVYLCPPADPYAVYAGRTYPPNYPAPPSKTRRPARCFASATAAARAGDPLAPPPSGAKDIGGVYLVPAAPSLARLCRRAARHADLTVLCPRLVPGAGDEVFCSAGASCIAPGVFVLEGSFAGPPGYVGAAPGQGHLWVIAYTRRSGSWPRDTLTGGTSTGRTTARGRPAVWISFPPGSDLNSGHIALRWRADGTTYAVSLHGHTSLNRRLVLAIARDLVPVTA